MLMNESSAMRRAFTSPLTTPFPAPSPNAVQVKQTAAAEPSDTCTAVSRDFAGTALVAEVALDELKTRFDLLVTDRKQDAARLESAAAFVGAAAAQRVKEAEAAAAKATFAAQFAQEAAFEAVRSRHAAELAEAIAAGKQSVLEAQAAAAEAAELAREKWLYGASISRWQRSALRSSLRAWSRAHSEQTSLLRVAGAARTPLRCRRVRLALSSWKAARQSRLASSRRLLFSVRHWRGHAMRGSWHAWCNATDVLASCHRMLTRACSVFRTELRAMRRALNAWLAAMCRRNDLRCYEHSLLQARER